MKVGQLYQKDEKEVKKDVENGYDISLGVDVSSLLDEINIYEISNAGRPELVLAVLKQNLMVLLGKLNIENEKAKQN